MSTESFFTEVVSSYRKLLLVSEAESSVLSLREYRRVRYVSWLDFQCCTSTAEVTAGLPVRSIKATLNIKSSGKKSLTCESQKETSRPVSVAFYTCDRKLPGNTRKRLRSVV